MTNQEEQENRTTILEKELNNAQKVLENAKKDYAENKKQKIENHLLCLIATIISIAFVPRMISLMFVEDITNIMFSSIFGEISVKSLFNIIVIFTSLCTDTLLYIETNEKIRKAKEIADGTELQILFLKSELTKEYANLNKKQQKKSKEKMLLQLKEQLKILKKYGAIWENFVKKDAMTNWKVIHKKKLEKNGINTELYESFVRRLELKRNLGEEV